jgi:RimJ/RimL family protein N-acetyltransferase
VLRHIAFLPKAEITLNGYNQIMTVINPEFLQAELEKNRTLTRLQPHQHYQMAILHAPDADMRGIISLALNNSTIQDWEIGWNVHFHYWGRSYATEAVEISHDQTG